jgi:hypothetical protein
MDIITAEHRVSRLATMGLQAIEITIDTSQSIVHRGMIILTTENTDLLIDTLLLLLHGMHIPFLPREVSPTVIHVIHHPHLTIPTTLPLHPHRQGHDTNMQPTLLLAHLRNLDLENVHHLVRQDGLVRVQFIRKSASMNPSRVVTTLHPHPSPQNRDPLNAIK